MRIINKRFSIFILAFFIGTVFLTCTAQMAIIKEPAIGQNINPDAKKSIEGKITIISPKSGADWYQNSSQLISWTGRGNLNRELGPVDVTLWSKSTNTLVRTIQSNVSGTEVTYKVPWNLSTTAEFEVRVTSKNFTNLEARQTVYIRRSTVTFYEPKGGETLSTGSMQSVKWTYTGTPGPLKLVLEDNFNSYLIKDSISCEVCVTNFTVPTPQSNSTNLRIAAYTADNSKPNPVGGVGFFTLNVPMPTITITQPAQGTSYKPDANIPIKWTYTGNIGSTVTVMIAPVAGGTPVFNNQISAGNGGQGGYDWKPPISVIDQQYAITVTSVQNKQISSKTTITVSKPSITITQPTSGASVQQGAVVPIRWNYVGNIGMVKVKVLVAANGSSVFETIVPVTQGICNSWSPPSFPTAQLYLIRVEGVTIPQIFSQIPVTVSAPKNGKLKVLLIKSTNQTDPNWAANYYIGGANFAGPMNAKITSVKNISQSSFVLWIIDGNAKQSPNVNFTPGSSSNVFNGMKLFGSNWRANLNLPYPSYVELEVEWAE